MIDKLVYYWTYILILGISLPGFSQENNTLDKIDSYTVIDSILTYDQTLNKLVAVVDKKDIEYHTKPGVMPILRSCETSLDMSPEDCTRNKLKDLMKYNAVYPNEIDNKRLEVIKLYFIVKEDGFVAYMREKSKGNILLVNEAIRVMNLINAYVGTSPFIPGKIGGKNVAALMIIPVLFQGR
ncbi:MAG TPA: hypothetical protein VK590_14475 [Saprospiraceae bacterium]|nr:hypothetical protein [Saprospiraceae bacterium]